MLLFNDLSMSQKKAVVAIVQHTPALKESGKVTLKEIVSITQDLASQRDKGAPKIGYPNWLFKNNKIERGIYQLPVPTDEEITQYNVDISSSKKRKKPSISIVAVDVAKEGNAEKAKLQSLVNEDEFLAELRANGISV